MDADPLASEPLAANRPRTNSLSYKFQRLRERIRAAIDSGEISGKLPGERTLARQFRVNAKTLSKALTDLAAEGVLERSIGRGTYVAGQAPESPAQQRWVVLADDNLDPLVTEILKLNPEARCADAHEPIRPSLLSQCAAVIECTGTAPAETYRNLMVRGIPVVETVRRNAEFSAHGVLFDRQFAGFSLARDLLLTGHVRLIAVENEGQSELSHALELASARYAPEAIMLSTTCEQVATLCDQRPSAIVCDGLDVASRARAELQSAGVEIGKKISLCAIGSAAGDAFCTGYFLNPATHAAAIGRLIGDIQPHRLSVLWLNGRYIDRETTSAITLADDASSIIYSPAMRF